jgi:putative acetyltransferase
MREAHLRERTRHSVTPKLSVEVRRAVPADAEAMLRAHHAAVHRTAKAWYSPEILEAWGAKLEDSYDQLQAEIADAGRIVLVAEADAHVAGFGMVVPSDRELRAVYVHPDHGRRGVGTAILKELEALAIARGVERLDLVSSLNAEAFYSRHGYEVLERTVHRLRSGHEMACVKMVKNLQPRNL